MVGSTGCCGRGDGTCAVCLILCPFYFFVLYQVNQDRALSAVTIVLFLVRLFAVFIVYIHALRPHLYARVSFKAERRWLLFL